MNYIIFDLEWNQPQSVADTLQEPVYLSGEIIEIGAVKLDEHFNPVDELRLYITPQYYTTMHKDVAVITGLHENFLSRNGMPFLEAYEQFVRWCGEDYAFMSWSMNDMPMLIDNMVLYGLDVSELPECYDIQRIFSREIMRGETRYSLETALVLLKEKGDRAHDALHDARNAAKICSHLDLDVYLGEYTSKVFGERPSGKRYENRREILRDPTLMEFFCPWCGQHVKCKEWVSLGNNTYMAYGDCPDGDEFLVQLSVVFHGKGQYSAKRIIFELSDDLWDIYLDRKDLMAARAHAG